MLDVFNMPLRKKKPLSLCGYFSPELRHTPKSDQLPQGQATPVTGIDQVINKIAHSDQLSKKSILKKAPTSHRHRFDFFNLGCRLICKPKSDNRPEAPPSTTIAKDEPSEKYTDTTKVTKRVTFGVPLKPHCQLPWPKIKLAVKTEVLEKSPGRKLPSTSSTKRTKTAREFAHLAVVKLILISES
jgi:hypothetical protein